MQKVVLKCENVTPLLSRSIASNNGRYFFELRSQSIKGVLHFWFRALAPTVINPHVYEGQRQEFVGLKKLEDIIFGSTENKSPFSISVQWNKTKIGSVKDFTNGEDKYLFKNALFGTYPMGNIGAYYSYLNHGSSLKITFRFRQSSSLKLRELVISLFGLLSHYGGLGAKSHHGFGSVRTRSVSGITPSRTFGNMPHTAAERLLEFINEIDPDHEKFDLNNEIIIFSDLNADKFPNLVHAKEKILYSNKNSWREIIRNIVARRSRNGDPISPWSNIKLKLRGYKTDSDIMNSFRRALFNNTPISENLVVKPSIMGLPINYQRIGPHSGTTGHGRVMISNIVDGEAGRKASPLHISVHVAKTGKYFARLLLMASMISEERFNEKPVLKVETSTHEEYRVFGYENYDHLWQTIDGGK